MAGRSVLTAGGIAIGAVVAALPAAWALRRFSRWGLALAAVPLMMPSYLAYAAYSTARGGDGPIARWLGGFPAEVQAGLSVGLALMGLVLWTWPLAALVLALGFSRVADEVLEQARLEGAGRLRRGMLVLGMSRGALVAAAGLVMVVMLGSAVPLHLAQVQTYSIFVWKLLDLYMDQGVAWRAAWPLVLVLALAAEVVARAGMRGPPPDDAGEAVDWSVREKARWWGRWGGGWTAVLAAGVWVLSVGVPVVLLALAVREVRLLGRFWREQGGAVADSAVVAALVGVGGALLAMLTWMSLALRRERNTGADRGEKARVVRGATRVMALGALLPGVMMGGAVLGAWPAQWVEGLGARVLLVEAHLARFGVVGVLAGWALWRSEPGWLRDMRVCEPGSSVSAWWQAWARGRMGVVAGVGLACAALSFHEIEASIMLQPPGTESMSRQLLQFLHYLRDQEVAAAGVNLMVGALVVAIVAGWLLSGRGAPAEPIAGVRR